MCDIYIYIIICELYAKYTYVMCDIYTHIIIRELYAKYTYVMCDIKVQYIHIVDITYLYLLFIVYYIFIHNK